MTAEIVRRTVLESTDGPIEHSVVQCVATHHFVMPTAALVQHAPATPDAVPTAIPRR
ncbi:hypothetical protein BH23ACT10_BH23ACT10_28560 [soil metagenome]